MEYIRERNVYSALIGRCHHSLAINVTLLGAIAIGIPPVALMVIGIMRNETERVGTTNELMIGLGISALSPSESGPFCF